MNKKNAEGYLDPTAYEALSNIEEVAAKTRAPNYRPLVYICSPYAGDVETNVRGARRYCQFAVEQKCIPIAAHLLFPQFLNDDDDEQRSLGLYMGCVLMGKCAEVWVFGETVSSGMAKEIKKAQIRGMPIRYFTSDCREVGA